MKSGTINEAQTHQSDRALLFVEGEFNFTNEKLNRFLVVDCAVALAAYPADRRLLADFKRERAVVVHLGVPTVGDARFRGVDEEAALDVVEGRQQARPDGLLVLMISGHVASAHIVTMVVNRDTVNDGAVLAAELQTTSAESHVHARGHAVRPTYATHAQHPATPLELAYT